MSWSELPDAIVEHLMGKVVECAALPSLCLVERRCRAASSARLAVFRPLHLPPFSLCGLEIIGRTHKEVLSLGAKDLGDAGAGCLARALANGAMANTKVSSKQSHSCSGLKLTAHLLLTLLFCTH